MCDNQCENCKCDDTASGDNIVIEEIDISPETFDNLVIITGMALKDLLSAPSYSIFKPDEITNLTELHAQVGEAYVNEVFYKVLMEFVEKGIDQTEVEDVGSELTTIKRLEKENAELKQQLSDMSWITNPDRMGK